MGKAWSDYMDKNAKREYEESDPIKIIDQLRAELARLQRNEDCVQRLIVWATENGWNGVDNSKILDVFISGLVDQLRAELAAVRQEQIATLTELQSFREYATALDAHVERMRSALQAIDDLSYSRGVTMEKPHWSLRVPGQSDAIQRVKEVLDSTPRQSLATIKVKTLREVAAKLETEAFARSDGSFHDAAVFVEQEAEKIEKEIA
jgi:hypothetical protein